MNFEVIYIKVIKTVAENKNLIVFFQSLNYIPVLIKEKISVIYM